MASATRLDAVRGRELTRGRPPEAIAFTEVNESGVGQMERQPRAHNRKFDPLQRPNLTTMPVVRLSVAAVQRAVFRPPDGSEADGEPLAIRPAAGWEQVASRHFMSI